MIVVAVIQRTGAGQKIKITISFVVEHQFITRFVEYAGKRARIALHFGFDLFKDFHGTSSRWGRCRGAEKGNGLDFLLLEGPYAY